MWNAAAGRASDFAEGAARDAMLSRVHLQTAPPAQMPRLAKMSDRWEARLRELQEFREERGHCDVPRKHPGGLGHWVEHQRRGGKEGNPHRNAEQTQKLEELGFRWDAERCSWVERFQQLQEFKEEHGHCNVPQKHPGGLGQWVMNQRRGGKVLECES